jgi:hypothetical protein
MLQSYGVINVQLSTSQTLESSLGLCEYVKSEQNESITKKSRIIYGFTLLPTWSVVHFKQ